MKQRIHKRALNRRLRTGRIALLVKLMEEIGKRLPRHIDFDECHKLPVYGIDWAKSARIAQIDKDASAASVSGKSLLHRLTADQQKELDAWSRSQAPVRGVVNMMAWPGWAEALQQNLISKP